ncbi:hypothetical protein QUB68_07025 [Microcoleus sp. A006_D1]|uniref:ribbon-helix-helix domain-containing protein n=1 Tax=Microcoleus sp. A006_D1 TaxID=3055267 RepID=UPI002FD371A1
MSDSERISVVLPTQAKKELEKLCDLEKRSISNESLPSDSGCDRPSKDIRETQISR